jgi:hypothetical protein
VDDPNHDQPQAAVRPSLRMLANRRNALKSTGPRTVAGKRRAALNSRKDPYSEDLERQFREATFSDRRHLRSTNSAVPSRAGSDCRYKLAGRGTTKPNEANWTKPLIYNSLDEYDA